jgi:hypothetical protein
MLNESFVPVAIDINTVKHQKDAEGDFFRHIAEQGHYAGRTKPTATRQGLYVVGVDGELLHSLNSTRADKIVFLMKEALKIREQRNRAGVKANAFRSSNQPDSRFASEFPDGGLILRETMRDLPRRSNPDHETNRHNFDHVWLTAKEKESFVPPGMKVGTSWQIPESTVRRIVAHHTVDQVRGEANRWKLDEVEQVKLTAKVVDVTDGKVKIKLSGISKCRKAPSGEVNPYNKRKVAVPVTSDLQIRGWIVYDEAEEEFLSFRMLAAGMRTGADVYNFRWKDQQAAPIGFAFEMLEDKPENRIKPKFATWNYFDDAE